MSYQKLFIGVLGSAVLLISSTFAYTASASLQSKLDVVADMIENLIESKGESFRTVFISTLNEYKTKYTNERSVYIIGFLIGELSGTGTSVGGEAKPLTDGYFGSYTINDATYGSEVAVVVDSTNRSITSNTLPNHETGTFPNPGNPNTITAQEKSWEFPLVASFVGNETESREVGVAINGIKFEPGTGESVSCESGETYRIEALQEQVDLGIDHQHAHVQPTGEYHYHGVSQDLVTFGSQVASNEDLVHVGFASDGFHMYYSKSGIYTPSYKVSTQARIGTSCDYRGTETLIEGTTPDGTYQSDRVFDASMGDLDECNGIEIDGQYTYILTDAFPFISRCLNGEVQGGGGPGAGGGQGGPGAGGARGQGGAGGPRGQRGPGGAPRQ